MIIIVRIMIIIKYLLSYVCVNRVGVVSEKYFKFFV